jgi:ComEC/Rec2-related protein
MLLGFFSRVLIVPLFPIMLLEDSPEEFSVVGFVNGEVRHREMYRIELPIVPLPALSERQFNREYWLCSAIALPWRNASTIRKGDIVAIHIQKRKALHAPHLLSYERSLQRKGYTHRCTIVALSHLYRESPSYRETTLKHLHSLVKPRAVTATNLFPSTEQGGLLLSLVVGARGEISTETEDAFREAGITHMLVLSGYQISLVGWGSIRAIQMPIRFSTNSALLFLSRFIPFIGLFLATLLVYLTSFEPSATRALIVLGVYVVGRSQGNRVLMVDALVASATLMVLLWPGCFLEPGFHLTFGALGGIYCSQRWYTAYTLPKRYFASLSTISFFTTCIGWLWFRSFSLFEGMITNALIAPIASVGAISGAVSGYITYLIGIDKDGYVIQLVARLVFLVREVVVLSTHSLATSRVLSMLCIVANGVGGVLMAKMLGCRVWGEILAMNARRVEDAPQKL